MKNKVLIALILLVVGLCGSLYYAMGRISTLNEEVARQTMNYRASEDSRRELTLTIDELKYSNDSLNQKILETIKEAGVKTRKVTEVVYVESKAEIHDTIVVKEPIFLAELDTIIYKPYTTIKLGIKPPSGLSVDLSVKSEMTAIFHTYKETVNPPKKFWLFRLFQKKKVVTVVDIVENNPYICTENKRFINVQQ